MGGAKQVTLVDTVGSATQQVTLVASDGTTVQTATVATSAPTNPILNQLWEDSTNELWKRWNGSSWVTVGGAGGGAPTGSAGGDLSGTYPNPGVAKIQGVAVTAAQGTLVSQLNGATTRSATATLVAGEETVYTGSTGSQTLTLPATPQVSSINMITNLASVTVTVAAGAGNTINNAGTVGSIVLPVNGSVTLTFIGTVWYAQDYGVLTGPSGTASGDLSGTYPGPTVAKINGTTLSGLATGILKNTTATGVPSIAAAADIPLAAIGATGPMPAATVLSSISVPTAALALNSQKITGLANGSAATDGAAFGQVPLASAVLPAAATVGAVTGSGTAWAKSDHSHTRGYKIASDYGYAAMTCPPDLTPVTGPAMVSGTIYAHALLLDTITTITSLFLSVSTAGSTLTNLQCGVALYDSTKTLIGSTFSNSSAVDLHTALASTGIVQCTLAATGTGLTSIAAGKYYAAIFQNGTTPAVLRCSTNSATANGNLSAANALYASADTGRTTSFPTTLGSFTAFGGAHFFAIL